MRYEPTFCVERSSDAGYLNEVANDPGVRPWIGIGQDEYDFTDAVSDTRNFLLKADGGCLFFVQLEPGYYEVHTLFVPSARGRNALRAARDAARWMFTHTDCLEIVTKVPDHNRAAKWLTRAAGGKLRFHRDNAWQTDEGLQGVDYYALTMAEWAANASVIAAAGEWFHDRIEAAKAEKSATIAPHDDDKAHDQYVGAVIETILAGQLEKGLWFYNHWARFSGYAVIRVIAENPIIIDIQDAVLVVRDNDFEVLLCR